MQRVYTHTNPTEHPWTGNEANELLSASYWMERNDDVFRANGALVPEVCHDTTDTVKEFLSKVPASRWGEWWVWPWVYLCAVHMDGADESALIDDLISTANTLPELMQVNALIKCFAYLTVENREKCFAPHRAVWVARQVQLNDKEMK